MTYLQNSIHKPVPNTQEISIDTFLQMQLNLYIEGNVSAYTCKTGTCGVFFTMLLCGVCPSQVWAKIIGQVCLNLELD